MATLRQRTRAIMRIVAIYLGGSAALNAVSSYALVIGIGTYPNFSGEDQLKYAASDARAFADFLTRPEGGMFLRDHIRVLIDGQATRNAIFSAISDLGKQVTSDDIFYFYFAGHGVRDDLDRAYFMPADGSLSTPNGLGIPPLDLFQEVRKRVGSRLTAFFIDACNAGAMYVDGTPRDAEPGVANQLLDAWKQLHAAGASGDVGFLSSMAAQRSWEDDDLKHGVFTYYLLKGLSGAADQPPYGNNDNIVRVGELYKYLVAVVSDYTRKKFAEQMPLILPESDLQAPLSLMAYQKDASATIGLPVVKSSVVVTVAPTQNSRLLNDPRISTITEALTKAGYTTHLGGYAVPVPNGVTAFGPMCAEATGQLLYFRKDLESAARDVLSIVSSIVPDTALRFMDADKWPSRETYLWYKEAVRLGLAQIEVCFGVP